MSGTDRSRRRQWWLTNAAKNFTRDHMHWHQTFVVLALHTCLFNCRLWRLTRATKRTTSMMEAAVISVMSFPSSLISDQAAANESLVHRDCIHQHRRNWWFHCFPNSSYHLLTTTKDSEHWWRSSWGTWGIVLTLLQCERLHSNGIKCTEDLLL